MLMHTRRRIRVRGVVIDTLNTEFLFPEGTFEQLAVVVIGGTIFSRVDKYEHLDWPPQVVIAEYGPTFNSKSGSLGYGKFLAMNGLMTKVYEIQNVREHEWAMHQITELHGNLIKKFQRYLGHEQHHKEAAWQRQVSALNHAIAAYGDRKLTLEQVLKQFEKAFEAVGPHHRQRGQRMVKSAWTLSAAYDRAFAEHFPVAYLFRDLRKVEFFIYGDTRDLNVKMISDEEKAEMSEAEYLQQQFAQIKTQQTQFKAEEIPFYQPAWLQAQHDFNRSVFELSQLKAYQQGGL